MTALSLNLKHTPPPPQSVPDDCTVGFTVDFVWKATSFDRMKTALHTFREYSASISGYLFHSILGHTLEPTLLRVQVGVEPTLLRVQVGVDPTLLRLQVTWRPPPPHDPRPRIKDAPPHTSSQVPKKGFNVPGLPELNHSQVSGEGRGSYRVWMGDKDDAY